MKRDGTPKLQAIRYGLNALSRGLTTRVNITQQKDIALKRSTKRNVDNWPNMRGDTLKAIADELIRARKKHPVKGQHLTFLRSYAVELDLALKSNHHAVSADIPGVSATQIYALAATVAAMAIRIMEEGSAGYAYGGNTQAPDLELTP